MARTDALILCWTAPESFSNIKKDSLTVDFLIGARELIIHHPMIVIFFRLMRERKEFVPPCALSLARCSEH